MQHLPHVAAALALLLLGAPASAQKPAPPESTCADQTSTLAIVDCTQARTRIWDQRLNAAYRDLMQRIDAGQRGPLKMAQRLWVQFRNANCRFYGAQEGSIRQIQAAECLRGMTQDRALELEKAMKFD